MVHHTNKALKLFIEQDDDGVIQNVQVSTYGGETIATCTRSGQSEKEVFSFQVKPLADDMWIRSTFEEALFGAIDCACQVVDKRAEDLGI